MHPVNLYAENFGGIEFYMFVMTDCRTGAKSLSTLKKYGFTPILMPPADYLSEGVASHTDMLLFIGFGKLFCHTRYYEGNKEMIDRLALIAELELSISYEVTGKQYPKDVLFNACIVGNRLICNQKIVSKHILNAARSADFEIINVPQGYTKCSVCIVGDNAIITADNVIARACASYGIEVLQISEGHVSLPPYDHGFIGGASGYHNGKVYFCGSLDTHPDGEKIKFFCACHGAEVVCLSDDKLQDIGTIFFV